MSGEESDAIEVQFKQFLADNKIDVSALKGTKEEHSLAKNAKEQRALAILKAVSLPFYILYPIETGRLPLQLLRPVPPEVGSPGPHSRGASRELLRKVRHDDQGPAVPLSAGGSLLPKLHHQVLRLLSYPETEPGRRRLPLLR